MSTVLTTVEAVLVCHWANQGLAVWRQHIDHMLSADYKQCLQCAVIVSRMKEEKR